MEVKTLSLRVTGSVAVKVTFSDDNFAD